MKNSIKVTILGAGSWGITLANHCSQRGHDVCLWEFDTEAAKQLDNQRKRESVLPGIELSKNIQITSNLNQALDKSRMIFIVVPSHVVRHVIKNVSHCDLETDAIFISCTKGIEIESQKRISEIILEEMPDHYSDRYTVLSGPSHAEEVSRQIPTAVVVASKNMQIAELVQNALNSSTFRLYSSQDVIGVEIGGALKNVIALAAGICDGAGFGDNTKAALQPRGLAEMTRLGRKLGANPMTFAGLSGMGDLIATCMSRHSRNRYVGEQIGKGKTLDQVMNSMSMVAEGVRTCKAANKLALDHNVEMPICRQVYDVLFENKIPKKAMEALMNRKVKAEIWY